MGMEWLKIRIFGVIGELLGTESKTSISESRSSEGSAPIRDLPFKLCYLSKICNLFGLWSSPLSQRADNLTPWIAEIMHIKPHKLDSPTQMIFNSYLAVSF